MLTYKLSTLVLASLCLTSCSTLGGSESSQNCTEGKSCLLKGRLTLAAGQPPAWSAVLNLRDGTCVKLALPDEFFTTSGTKSWRNAAVEVKGAAFLQPSFKDEDAVLWYEQDGRKVATGICDGGMGLRVDSMRSRLGAAWPSPSL